MHLVKICYAPKTLIGSNFRQNNTVIMRNINFQSKAINKRQEHIKSQN